MLGRTSRESGALARSAARLGGWQEQDDELLDLGPMTATLTTIANIDDVAAVLHLGHPAQPAPELEHALLRGPAAVVVTSAVAVPGQWAWVGSKVDSSGDAIVDEAGMRDCRYDLRAMGVRPHLVPNSMSVADRVALAGNEGTLLVERERIPAGFMELPGSSLLSQEPLWFGLAQARQPCDFSKPAQVWLAFGPANDHRGSLQASLSVIADAGFDLHHLRSQRSTAGTHVFFSSFLCPDSTALNSLLTEFTERHVQHRVLAVLEGDEFVPGPQAVEPQWRSN